MQIIGITGGMGSGKSTIARELVSRGYAVYDCDQEAKRIIAKDKNIQEAIRALLGEASFIAGQYNTTYVSRRVFADPTLLEHLNAIIHPAVKAAIKQLTVHGDHSVLFVESAILYEAGLDTLCDKVVVIDAPESIRIERTLHRDYHDVDTPAHRAAILSRIKSQLNHTGDLRIVNDGKTPIADLAQRILTFL